MQEEQKSHAPGHILYPLICLLVAAAVGLIGFWASDSSSEFNSELFIWALAVGIFAQLVDGALGMAYGVTATTFLLSAGVAPVTATASVHVAEIFTTGASGLSHWRMGNILKPLFLRLLIPGILGGVAGVLLITSIDGNALRPWMAAYLLLMGVYIIYRAFRVAHFTGTITSKKIAPLAFIGAFVDSIGGGGWGPVVTTTLLGSGHEPRTTIGSVNSAECFVTIASGFSFAVLVGITEWEIVAGLIVGGILAAPIAARVTAKMPTKWLMVFVGTLIACLSAYTVVRAVF